MLTIGFMFSGLFPLIFFTKKKNWKEAVSSIRCNISNILCVPIRWENRKLNKGASYRQFLVCGGPSSSRIRAKRAALRDRPRIPSPHSFSALQHTHTRAGVSDGQVWRGRLGPPQISETQLSTWSDVT